MEVSSDAAGSLGYGAFLKGYWFVGSRASSRRQQSIAYKKLFPVVIAAHVWGHQWSHQHVLFHSDNDAVVHIGFPGPQKFRTSYSCFAACYLPWFTIVSPFLPSMSQALRIRLLMLSVLSLAGVPAAGSRCSASSDSNSS